MATIRFLGTCSGTEPMPGMHHSSWILEFDDAIYWFDAGENCAHAAYTAGVDVMKTKALFISHPHPDHTGGLANLFFTVNKMVARYGQSLQNGTLHLFCAEGAVVEASKTISMGKPNAKMRFDLNEQGMQDGLLYEDEHLRVQILHNTHIKGDGANGVWHAFSFLLETEGKRILFTGDIGKYSELDGLIGDGAVDLLIGETGHHAVADACEYAVSRGVKRLLLTHHGREVLEQRERVEALCESYQRENPISIALCHDGMVEVLS